MKMVKTVIVLVVALLLLLPSTALGCTKQQTATLVLAPAEVTAGRTAATHVSGVDLTAGQDVRIMVVVDGLEVDYTPLCDPKPVADGRGSFLTKMNLGGFAPGDYPLSVADEDRSILATVNLRVVAPAK